MRILHVCLSAFYIEGYAYQENILPRIHKKMGNEVKILASTETYLNHARLGYIEPCRYVNGDGIEVTRIPYISWIPRKIASKVRAYKGVAEYLEEYEPDFIFLHDVQFLNILDIRKYKVKHPSIIVVADGHTDYKNSAKSFASREILHRIYYKGLIQRCESQISKFYGTLPSRNLFFTEMYGINANKVEYLPMGIDDEKRDSIDVRLDREAVRKRLGISNDDILLITGGKVTKNKIGIINLIRIMRELPTNVKLLLFGSIDEEMQEIYDHIEEKDKVINVGWLTEDESIKYMLCSDIAVFPCLHSTLWEQAAGTGLPCILLKMENFTHIDVNNNCIFMNGNDEKSIHESVNEGIVRIVELKSNAKMSKDYFSYSYIGKRVIADNAIV